jgi:hypothetical protein
MHTKPTTHPASHFSPRILLLLSCHAPKRETNLVSRESIVHAAARKNAKTVQNVRRIQRPKKGSRASMLR